MHAYSEHSLSVAIEAKSGRKTFYLEIYVIDSCLGRDRSGRNC